MKRSSRPPTAGFGQSTCVGIGGDPIPGSNFIDILKLFQDDPKTEAIVMIGEIGGSAEEEAAASSRPCHQAGGVLHRRCHRAEAGKRMGHAGAIISGGKGTADEKFAALEDAGSENRAQPGRYRQGHHSKRKPTDSRPKRSNCFI
jgi:succinyl-CoA synthetase alpha subunit